jgi:hypothetical protein
LVPGAEKAIPPEAYNAALATRPRLQKLFADTFAQNRIAAIAFAMTPLPAAPIGDDEKTKLNGQDVPTFPTFIRNADPGSNAGIPGITIPIARTQAGLPIGLGLDGPGRQRPQIAFDRACTGEALRPAAGTVARRQTNAQCADIYLPPLCRARGYATDGISLVRAGSRDH